MLQAAQHACKADEDQATKMEGKDADSLSSIAALHDQASICMTASEKLSCKAMRGCTACILCSSDPSQKPQSEHGSNLTSTHDEANTVTHKLSVHDCRLKFVNA